MLTKVEGNTITHRWGLNTDHVHEIVEDQWSWQVSPKAGGITWDLGAPALGQCWVLSSITVSFDDDPQLPAILWVDADSGADVYWIAYVGHLPPPLAVTQIRDPLMAKFSPAIKFPVNQDVAINWFDGDPLVWFFITWQCWQEAESVS